MTQGFTSGMRSSLDDTWTTPRDFFEKLDDEFLFGLDAAALSASTLVPDNWYGPDHPDPERRNAFDRDWRIDSGGSPIWLNPPYGRTISAWVGKANTEALLGGWWSAWFLLELIQVGGITTASSTK
jgi:hypothetical protein